MVTDVAVTTWVSRLGFVLLVYRAAKVRGIYRVYVFYYYYYYYYYYYCRLNAFSKDEKCKNSLKYLKPKPILTFTTPRSAHTLYLCVLCGSQNKQPLFPYTTLTDWFV